MMAKQEYRVIGTRPIRPDGYGKVIGRDQYAADVILPGMIYAKILRSPHPHALIKRIDFSKALAHPSVLAVCSGEDFPHVTSDEKVDTGEESISARHMTALAMASGKVLYKGQPVAAVACASFAEAEEALKLIEVEYEPLPVVDDIESAMAEGAPLIHGDLYTTTLGGNDRRPSNIASHVSHVRGDVESAFAEADVVVEREFRTQMVHQGYIEPQSATVQAHPSGRMTVWTSTQGAWQIRNQMATIFQLPEGKIRVIPMEIGGGFGGKFTPYVAPVAAVLSRKTGRPVKAVMKRSEVFQATGPGSGSIIRVKMGAKKDGTFVAAEAFLAFDAGAFPGSPVGAACVTGFSPYKIPNLKLDGYDVVTNHPRVKAYRAPGGTPIGMAVETVIDEIAVKLGMDPIDLRYKNAVEEGDRMVNDVQYNSIGFKQVLEAIKSHPHYNAPLEGKNVGRGVACGFWGNGGGRSTVHLSFVSDGTVNLIEGSTDIGGTRASMAMIAAEELGLEIDDIRPFVADTDTLGYNDGTGGSRVTYSTGVAVYKACQDAIQKLKKRAAILLEVEEDEVEYEEGVFRAGDKEIATKQVIAKLNQTGGPFEAQGVSGGLGRAPSFSASLVDLEVDPETGKIQIKRWTQFQDVGKAIHPSYAEGQLQGAAVQGIGWGVSEEYVFRDGHMLNPSFLDYRIPTALDVPMIDTVLIEVPASDGPYGVRGVGEAGIVPPPAAIANAIYRAVGVRMSELPMSPERVWKAISEANASIQESVAEGKAG